MLDIKGVWKCKRRRCCVEPCFWFLVSFSQWQLRCQSVRPVDTWVSSSILDHQSSSFVFRFSPWYLPSFPLDRVMLKWPVHVLQSAHLVSYNKEVSVVALCCAVTEGLFHVQLILFLLASNVSQDFIKMEIVQINWWVVKDVKMKHSQK